MDSLYIQILDLFPSQCCLKWQEKRRTEKVTLYLHPNTTAQLRKQYINALFLEVLSSADMEFSTWFFLLLALFVGIVRVDAIDRRGARTERISGTLFPKKMKKFWVSICLNLCRLSAHLISKGLLI